MSELNLGLSAGPPAGPEGPIAAIILTYNQAATTLACLESLLACAGPPFRVLVWDNGSTDATAERVGLSYPHVMLHQEPSNLGVAGGRNAAARLALASWRPSHLLFLDNDMLVEPDFVGALWRPFRDDGRLGQTQAKLRFMRDRGRLNDGGGAQINYLLGQIRPVGFGEPDKGQHDRVRPCVACGGAMLVRADLFEALGGFDPLFGPFGPEDLDFSLRLRKAGYKALYIPQAVAYHQVSHTFGRGYTEEYARYKSKHWRLFLRRHATRWQKLGFYLAGAPYLALRMAVREGRRGNLRALRGALRGLVDPH
ncbi:MAG: glycosyltransferase family 2 protein [Candidatus Promineifilaceae bacterium]